MPLQENLYVNMVWNYRLYYRGTVDPMTLIHGHATRTKGMTPEYKSWAQMKQRCTNRKLKDWPRYGGRGIRFCKRWLRFENFLVDMGLKPSRHHSIDRIDNDGNYNPKNCRIIHLIQEGPEIKLIPRRILYENVRARKAMTIGICARCTDGVVIMADRQITKAGGLKYYQRKVWSFGSGIYHVSSVYAGIPEMAQAFQLEFKRGLPADPYAWEPSQDDLQDLIEACLRRVWRKHRSDMQLEMLLCTRTQDSDYQLWRSSGKVLTDADLECIGVGDSSVIRYFFETFAWRSRWMNLEFFVPFGLYVMQQAKKYIEGCGGRTDCIIFREGKITYVSSPHQHIKEIEEEMESLEADVVNLFENYAVSKLSQEQFAQVLEKFAARIERSKRSGKVTRLLA